MFLLNKHILPHCQDDITLYTQRDMCAVCESMWRKIADKGIVSGKIYVLSSEPYVVDESWKRHNANGYKLVKIPTRLTKEGDLRNLYLRNLLLNKSISGKAIALYTAIRNLFIEHEFKLLKILEDSTFNPEKILNFSKELVSQSSISSPELLDIILKFTKEQMLNHIEMQIQSITGDIKDFFKQFNLDKNHQVNEFILGLTDPTKIDSSFQDFKANFLSKLENRQNIVQKISERYPIIKALLEKRFFVSSI